MTLDCEGSVAMSFNSSYTTLKVNFHPFTLWRLCLAPEPVKGSLCVGIRAKRGETSVGSDARTVDVLAHTGSRRRKTHRELEQPIRERLYDLGVPGVES